MKKFITLMLSASLVLGTLLTSCGSTAGNDETTPSESTSANTNSGDTSADTDADTSADTSAAETTAPENTTVADALRASFLEKADEVVVNDDSVTFTDASGKESVTIAKDPKNVVNLYASFTTLWYEAGGTVSGCIGGDSSIALYEEYTGRDITADDGVTTVATSSSGKKWNTETIIALEPELIICSTAMSGYKTIEAPAEAAGIPVIAMSYNDFADYLKWFKVFSNLTGHPELYEEVALKALDYVVDVLLECPAENNPTVFCMFSSADTLQANTSGTVVGGMISAMNAKNIVDAWDGAADAERLDINLETVFAADPDIILVQCHAGTDDAMALVETLYGDNPVWQSLSAVKNGKVYYLEKSLFHNKPNSRFAEAYKVLAQYLYPDAEF
ncbi:MAG: ABC transporter substrate-binding protein [Candidatus Flemingibacterium sp.]|nr:ABC transporter substrate-binding protein [Candidatus Flemingibacterium sp.]